MGAGRADRQELGRVIRRLVLEEGALGRGPALELGAELAHYVRTVLRAMPGDRMVLSDGAGLEAEAEIASIERQRLCLNLVEAPRVLPPAPGPALTLIQAVGKGDKMDQLIRQASELGVRRVVPVLSARAVAERGGRVERWRAIAEDAVRVSGRPHRPVIEAPVVLAEVLARPRAEIALVLAGSAAEPLKGALDRAGAALAKATVELLIGPEGGFDPVELEQAAAYGFLPVHLGAYTLRTETAGPAAAAMVLFSGGGFSA